MQFCSTHFTRHIIILTLLRINSNDSKNLKLAKISFGHTRSQGGGGHGARSPPPDWIATNDKNNDNKAYCIFSFICVQQCNINIDHQEAQDLSIQNVASR